MPESRRAADLPKGLTAALTIAAVAAVVGVAVRIDRAYGRAYGRWWTEMSPLTKPRARAVKLRTDVRRRRVEMSDITGLISDLWDEVDRAAAAARD
jgi:hypothetical protein